MGETSCITFYEFENLILDFRANLTLSGFGFQTYVMERTEGKSKIIHLNFDHYRYYSKGKDCGYYIC
jgi:hypothetical protein